MNHHYVNIIGEDAFLILSPIQQQTEYSYIKLIANYQKAYSVQNKTPCYILKNKNPLIYPNTKYVETYVKEIEFAVQYLQKKIGFKKLTVLAFQYGALLAYRTLAVTQIQLCKIIEKIVLINIYNPSLKIYDNEPSQFLQQTKRIIFRNNSKIEELNKLRIIYIRTLQAPYPILSSFEYRDQYYSFQLGYNMYKFKNTVTVSSRFMWNVYCQLNSHQYFHFQPFVWILSKFFIEDRQYKLQKKDIQYLFLYRQSITPRQISQRIKQKYNSICKTFYLQTYSYNGDIFTDQCTRLVKKDPNYFQNSSLLIYANQNFDVYGEKYEKLFPMDSKLNHVVYLIQNLQNVSKIYIVNTNQIPIKISISPGYQPKNNPIIEQVQNISMTYEKRVDIGLTFIIVCPGHKLIYPIHFQKYNTIGSNLVMMHPINQYCYSDSTGFQLNWPKLLTHWGIQRNVAIFTIFCSHVTGMSTYKRFFTQWFVNQLITLSMIQNNGWLLWENMITVSVVVILQLLLKVLTMLAFYFGVPKNYLIKLLFVPLILQITNSSFILKGFLISHWNILSLIACSLLNKKNEHILFIQMYFMDDYILKNESNIWGMTMIIMWMCASSFDNFEQIEKQKINQMRQNNIKSKKQDSLSLISKYSTQAIMIKITKFSYLFLIALCLSQSAIVIQYIIDFYVITYTLLAARKKINELIK